MINSQTTELMIYQRQLKKLTITKLIYHFKGPHVTPINFIKHESLFHIFKEIRDGDKTLQEIKEDKNKFKSSLGQITSGDPDYKDYQKDEMKKS